MFPKDAVEPLTVKEWRLNTHVILVVELTSKERQQLLEEHWYHDRRLALAFQKALSQQFTYKLTS